MNKWIGLLIIILNCTMMQLNAQKYFTREGEISFISSAIAETIEAKNSNATCVIDYANGDIQLAVLIKGFQFEKALMQEHFNENYLESDQYPKAKFKGKVENISSIDLSIDGKYPIRISGKLTIHGITKTIYTSGEMIVLNNQIIANSNFDILVADYHIIIPKVVRENIAKNVTISIAVKLEQLKR